MLAASVDTPEWDLAQLKEKDREVLERRFGLNGRERETLAEIGNSLALTRERIRQIEARGLRDLRTQFARDFKAYLERRREDIWRRIARATQGAAASTDRFSADALTPEEQLSMAVLNIALVDLVRPIAREISGGWVLRDITDEALGEARRLVKEVATKGQLPAAIDFVSKGDGRAVSAAIEIDRRVTLWSGYVVRRPVTRRVRRTVRLHRLMREEKAAPIHLKLLHALYRSRHQDDQCSTRDLLIVMGEARHLFLNLYEEGWAAFGTALQSDLEVDTEQQQGDDYELDVTAGHDGVTTVAGFLRKILREEGPLPFDDLRDRFMLLTNGAYSRSSVGPILLVHADFIRFAPGIYGLEDQLSDPARLAAAQVLLLDERQLTLYCQARWAREPRSLYPIWTPRMERAWADWAYAKGLKDHLHALLTVSDIAAWPVAEAEQTRWIARRELGDGFHLLARNPLALTDTLPSYVDVLRVAMYARYKGGVSWISANRVRGLRVDDRHAHSALAFLVWLGVLKPASHWQAWHEYEPQESWAIDDLISAYRESGGQEWPSSLIDRHRAGHGSAGGWVEEYEVEVFLDRMLGDKVGEDFGEGDKHDDLESMMQEVAIQHAIRGQGLA
jgi:hypothetical protein